jgi:MoaA/NifB/PqqE/SkfB family radical SAM enzyme
MGRRYFIRKEDAPLRNLVLSLFRKETLDFPDTVLLETSSGCNGLCVFCLYEATRESLPNGRMDEALFTRIIDELAEHRVKKIIPCFINEPLLDPCLCDRLAAIRKKCSDTIISLTTNASHLTSEKAQRILEENLADEVNISFQGLSRESYEASMRGLSFERTLENVKSFLNMRGKNRRPVVTVTTVETNVVQAEFQKAPAFWKPLGAKFKSLPFETRSGDVRHSLKRTDRELSPVVFCPRPFNTLVVTFDGKVPICCADYTRKSILGDANTETFETIWNGPAFREVRRAFLEGRAGKIPACRNCEVAK